MSVSRIPAPSSLQQARLMLALANVLGLAQSRAEDLTGYKEDGEEDPTFAGADEAWGHIRFAEAELEAMKSLPWTPVAGDWVSYSDAEDTKSGEVLAQVVLDQVDDLTQIRCEDGRTVSAQRWELRLLARPTQAELGGLALIAESPTDPANSNNYTLQVPDGTDGEAVWISVGNAALQMRVHGADLTVSAHPDGEDDSATWGALHVEEALQSEIKPSP